MARFEHEYVLNVMSDDHPGIVAAVTGTVEDLGGNMDACSQTVLGGFFTLIMIVSLPEKVDAEELAERVRKSQSLGSDYQVMARAVRKEDVTEHDPAEWDRFVITAFGKDQPGIVRQFSQYLAGRDINIVDLYGCLKDAEFILVGELEVPVHWDIQQLQDDLEQMGSELGFTVKLQHHNIFVATNEIRMNRSMLE